MRTAAAALALQLWPWPPSPAAPGRALLRRPGGHDLGTEGARHDSRTPELDVIEAGDGDD